MIQINNPADCCGCTACASICAHDAITMKPDALGFYILKWIRKSVWIVACVRRFVPSMIIMIQV